MIDQAAVVRKILARLRLATEALTKRGYPVWLPKTSTLRGPPAQMLPLEVDEDQRESFVDELPADD